MAFFFVWYDCSGFRCKSCPAPVRRRFLGAAPAALGQAHAAGAGYYFFEGRSRAGLHRLWRPAGAPGHDVPAAGRQAPLHQHGGAAGTAGLVCAAARAHLHPNHHRHRLPAGRAQPGLPHAAGLDDAGRDADDLGGPHPQPPRSGPGSGPGAVCATGGGGVRGVFGLSHRRESHPYQNLGGPAGGFGHDGLFFSIALDAARAAAGRRGRNHGALPQARHHSGKETLARGVGQFCVVAGFSGGGGGTGALHPLAAGAAVREFLPQRFVGIWGRAGSGPVTLRRIRRV